MIKTIIGDIGSGKSLNGTKDIVLDKGFCFCNWQINSPNALRLTKDMIIEEYVHETLKNGREKKKMRVNWDFWNEQKKIYNNFSIYIDEVHNVANSRRGMSDWNVCFNTWLTQIRKILQGHKNSHLVCMSQRLSSIDPVIRELTSQIIYIKKFEDNTKKIKTLTYDSYKDEYTYKLLPKIIIMKKFFTGQYCLEKFNDFIYGVGDCDYESAFVGNRYFKFYDTYEMIRFGDGTYV